MRKLFWFLVFTLLVILYLSGDLGYMYAWLSEWLVTLLLILVTLVVAFGFLARMHQKRQEERWQTVMEREPTRKPVPNAQVQPQQFLVMPPNMMPGYPQAPQVASKPKAVYQQLEPERYELL